MQHRMDDTKLEVWEKRRGRIIERDDVSREDLVRAEYHSYRNDKGKFFLPADHVQGSLINAGAFIKSKVGNARKSMKNIVAGMFSVTPDELPLGQKFVIDKRSAVNRNIKGRIICIRPKWESWETEFTLEIDNDTLTTETIREIVAYAGQYCGIGSFRPTNNGRFGRFEITQFKLL